MMQLGKPALWVVSYSFIIFIPQLAQENERPVERNVAAQVHHLMQSKKVIGLDFYPGGIKGGS